jgi:hypothetical protein
VSPVVLGAARLKILPSDLETCAATNDASLKGNTPAAAAKILPSDRRVRDGGGGSAARMHVMVGPAAIKSGLSCQAGDKHGSGASPPKLRRLVPTAAIPAVYLLVECKRLFSSPLLSPLLPTPLLGYSVTSTRPHTSSLQHASCDFLFFCALSLSSPRSLLVFFPNTTNFSSMGVATNC